MDSSIQPVDALGRFSTTDRLEPNVERVDVVPAPHRGSFLERVHGAVDDAVDADER